MEGRRLTGYLRTGARQPRLCTDGSSTSPTVLHLRGDLIHYNRVSSLLRGDDSIRLGEILCEDFTSRKFRWIVIMVIRKALERNFLLYTNKSLYHLCIIYCITIMYPLFFAEMIQSSRRDSL